ncbi:hypothetical protein [Amycolatopsis silviterrae]|uniref:Uncharacterized protein n=1 Tax=Amycolatopsis silviterrae TaxID=1656914 RepID=A0ABW5HJJ6_9PSEU
MGSGFTVEVSFASVGEAGFAPVEEVLVFWAGVGAGVGLADGPGWGLAAGVGSGRVVRLGRGSVVGFGRGSVAELGFGVGAGAGAGFDPGFGAGVGVGPVIGEVVEGTGLGVEDCFGFEAGLPAWCVLVSGVGEAWDGGWLVTGPVVPGVEVGLGAESMPVTLVDVGGGGGLGCVNVAGLGFELVGVGSGLVVEVVFAPGVAEAGPGLVVEVRPGSGDGEALLSAEVAGRAGFGPGDGLGEGLGLGEGAGEVLLPAEAGETAGLGPGGGLGEGLGLGVGAGEVLRFVAG